MKKEYMKPTMRVVKIQHSGIICTSPGGGSGWAGMTGTCHIRQCKDMALF